MIDLRAIAQALPDAEAYVRLLGLVPHRGPRRDTVRILCPWHGDTTPSCDVIRLADRIGSKCRACDGGGDHLHLFAAANGLDLRTDFRRAALELAKLLGVTAVDTPRARQPKPRDPLIVLAKALERAAEDMLAGRALHPRDAAAFDAATARQCELALKLLGRAVHQRRVREIAQAAIRLAEERVMRRAWDLAPVGPTAAPPVNPKPNQRAA